MTTDPTPIDFDEALRARLGANLEAHDRRELALEGRRHAAVAVVVIESEADGASFLLCQRPLGMRRHPGQWALPGGRLDPGEAPIDAALRELEEELGLTLGADHVVGWLDDYATRSGFVISPVVLWCAGDPVLVPDPDEVYAAYRFGLHDLRDGTPRLIDIPESDRPVVQIPLGGDLIHAPTGAILFQFREVGLLARTGFRVDHVEEPVFAWR